MLIAQELTYYGLDIYKKRALPDLLEALAAVDGIEWIKLHYAYPSKFPLEILDVMRNEPKVCNYLDIPLQHASDNMLKAMKRHITLDETKNLIRTIKQRVPGIAIRTTFLLGFPGETEEDVEHLIEFIKEMRFDRVGVFEYSHEEDTSAHELVDNVPAEEKSERCNRVMAIQQEISQELNEAKIGKTFKVLFDRLEGGYFIGRTEFDSPEVDNEVLVDATKHYISVGDFAMIQITAADSYDLYGEPVLNPLKA
jgi:ribosomal protein S12 methylthiotransferase